ADLILEDLTGHLHRVVDDGRKIALRDPQPVLLPNGTGSLFALEVAIGAVRKDAPLVVVADGQVFASAHLDGADAGLRVRSAKEVAVRGVEVDRRDQGGRRRILVADRRYTAGELGQN